jgi:protein-S-isoprenylcysteine O-methyltransferase Ste14
MRRILFMTRINLREILSKWGGWFFYQRGLIPVPFFIVLFFLNFGTYENDLVVWISGLLFLILGEVLRCWGIKHIGKHSRTRKRQCKSVVMSGPYALTRNPLYLGNLCIMIGFTVLSELLWFLAVALPLFLFYYTCIVIWEEDILKETFPEEAARYFEKVPRWYLIKGMRERFRGAFLAKGDTPLKEVIYREYRTLQFLAVMTILLLLKELFNNHDYPIWIPFLFN